MSTKRLARLNEQIKREISEILRRDVRDPRVGAVTVTRVEVSGDLWVARVFVRLAGAVEERGEGLAGLEAAAPFMRRLLGRELHIRRVPELHFREDRALDHATRIDRILKDLSVPPAEDDGAGSDGDGGTDA
jgi:ribosome-binding factor A